MNLLKKKKKRIPNCRTIVSAVLLTALIFAFSGTKSLATGEEMGNIPTAQEAVVAGRRTTEEGVFIYIRNAGTLSGTPTVQIGNTLCENVEVMESIRMKTLVLLDNSQSISTRWGTESVDLIRGMIQSPAEGEEIKLATFADGLTVWEDYSRDLPTLLSIADLIPFENQDSFLTDILYELLKAEADSEEACYSRFVLITDGADDNEVTYTQDELKELMRSSGISIHTLGVNTGSNNKELENLFSYARLTNGNYQMVNKGDGYDGFLDLVKQDRYLVGIKVLPPRDLQDGSTKEAKITIPTETGEIVLKSSLQMPFASAEAPTEAVEVQPTPEAQITPAVEPQPTVVEPAPAEEIPEEKGFPWIAVIACGVALLIILIVIIVLIVSHKKKQEKSRRAIRYLADPKVQKQSAKPTAEEKPAPEKKKPVTKEQGEDRTISLFGGDEETEETEVDAESTISLWDEEKKPAEKVVKHFYVVLKESGTDREFRSMIRDKIVIGRSKDSDIALDFDRAVSGKHCQIEKRGDSFYITDLGSSNGTECEGRTIREETLLHHGATLVLGHGTYQVEFEEK